MSIIHLYAIEVFKIVWKFDDRMQNKWVVVSLKPVDNGPANLANHGYEVASNPAFQEYPLVRRVA